MVRATFILLPLFLAAGCSLVSPQAKVRDRLIAAGVKPKLAHCMAEKLTRKLSPDELRTLDRATRDLPSSGGSDVTIEALADRLQSLDDPHISEVVVRTGLGCAILG